MDTSEGEKPVKSHTIRLMEHCIFCLRKTTNAKIKDTLGVSADSELSAGSVDEVPSFEERSSTTTTLLSTLNKTWGYLQQGGNWKWDNDFNQMIAQFTNLPKLCRFCAHQLGVIDKLVVLLIKEINKLGSVMRESRYGGKDSGRVERFERTLRSSGVDWDTVVDTLTFLGKPPMKESPDVEGGSLQPKMKQADWADNDSKDGTRTEETKGNPSCLKEEQASESDDDDDDDGAWQEEDFKDERSDTIEEMTYEVPSLPQGSSSAVGSPSRSRGVQISLGKSKDATCVSELDPVQSHKKECSGPRIRSCDLCRARMPKGDIPEHVRGHVGDYLVKCPNPACMAIAFCTMSGLTRHLHAKKTCREWISQAEGEQYRRIKGICEVCDRHFDETTLLCRHIQLCHENTEKLFACPLPHCQERFSLRQSVLLHLRLHDLRKTRTPRKNPAVRKHKCKECDVAFRGYQALTDHRILVHGRKPWSCHVCAATFPTHLKREQHRKKHVESMKVFPCQEPGCGKVCSSKRSLTQHVAFVHNGERPHVCENCGNSFATKGGMVLHIRTVHEPRTGAPSEFRCDVPGCGRVFKTRKGFRHHTAATHTGEKPHVCEHCGKSFVDKDGLKIHLRGWHTGTPPCICDVCGEGFKLEKYLQRHKLIHTGERPFACGICDQRFRQKVVLVRHLSGHKIKGADFKPSGPMKKIRKRVEKKNE